MEQSYKQKFYEYYSNNVLPQMIKCEPYRKSMCRKFFILLFIDCLLLVLAFFFSIKVIYYLKNLIDDAWKMFLCFYIWVPVMTAFFGLIKEMKGINRKYKREIKEKFIPLFISSLKNLYWNSAPIKESLLKDSHLFRNFYSIKIYDNFLGIYGHTKFTVQEIMLSDTSEDTTKARPNVFRGVVITINSSKKVKSKVLIYPKYRIFSVKGSSNIMIEFLTTMLTSIAGTIFFVYLLVYLFLTNILVFIIGLFILYPVISAWYSWFISTYKKFKSRKRIETIKLEDVSFSKKFTVQSQDQIEARYLVTTAFMERLQNFQTIFGTKNIKCAFLDDKIMFAISTKKDFFELGDLFTPLTSSKYINKFYDEIISIYEMIDHFKLTQKTGL